MCPNGTFSCTNGLQCISASEVCDGAADCSDGTDERAEMCKGMVVITLNTHH